MTDKATSAANEQIVIQFTKSPSGKKCIGMTFNKKLYLLLTTKTAPSVILLRQAIFDTYQIETLEGPPIDRDQSLKAKKLVLAQGMGFQSIFVPEKIFDQLSSDLNILS